MHEGCLPTATLRLADRLVPAAHEHGLALGGGSACALWLGHRTSADLDFFSLTPLDPPALLLSLASAGERRLRGISAAELALTVDGVDVSATSLGREALGATTEWRGLSLLAIEDLAELKLAAAVARGTVRDLCDLHLLCAAGADVRRSAEVAGIDLVVALKALTDADRFTAEPALDLRVAWTVEEGVAWFEGEARRLLNA